MLLNDESQHDEMITILETIQKLTPSHTSNNNDIHYQGILLGDQFSINETQRLTGIVPVIEGWHTKLCYLTVCNTPVLLSCIQSVNVIYFLFL